MKKLFNAASKLFTAFFFILLIISSASCRHLQKSQSIKKMGKYLLAVAVVVAVEELAGSELLERIEGAPEDQKPINVTIINENNHEIELGLTNNGHYWKKEIQK